ncbi:MAG: endonuclease [Bacteroidetes bacterium]|nr:endonuclease [Bacteroidota bacterium]
MKNNTVSKLHLLYLIGLIPLLNYSCQVLQNSEKDSQNDMRDIPFNILFYNVENLFDTLDDPHKNDNDFLPGGDYHWNSYRYFDKLNKISKVVLAAGKWETMDIIGLCEIENRKVLEDLIYHTPLQKMKYEIIHKESPDRRGIDVALIYSRQKFKPLYYDFTAIDFPFDSSIKTREILYVKGIVAKRDTLHFFINHWPSRRGGKEASEKRRLFVALTLKSRIDSIHQVNPGSNILIMGDFNDEPTDKSIHEYLDAGFDILDLEQKELYNATYQFQQKGKGSYKYKYEWNQLDQFIISSNMLSENNNMRLKLKDVELFSTDWLLTEDTHYTGSKPFRTYLGPRYMGGFSDHLPIHMTLWIRR